MPERRHPDVEPSYPGRILLADIDALGVSKVAVAEALGISRRGLYDVLEQKNGVSPEMALRLEAVFGGAAEFWLNMQAAYDLWAAGRRVDLSELKRLEAAE